jgi:hypothetical protein
MSEPGEVVDRRGIPIYPGDLIRSPHFKDRRGKQWWLYHVAVWNAAKGAMEMVPASHLEPTKVDGGGRCWLNQCHAIAVEIIDGCGPGDVLDFTDRERRVKPEHQWKNGRCERCYCFEPEPVAGA